MRSFVFEAYPLDHSAFASLPAAGIPRRLFAALYDLLLLAAISLAYAALVLLIRLGLEGPPPQGGMMPTPNTFVGVLIMLGWWLALAGYFNWCWLRRGQTLAMKTWRLRLQQPDGTLPTARQRWLRAIIAPLSLASVIGLLWRLIDANGDCLHDRLTATRVVLLPKKIN